MANQLMNPNFTNGMANWSFYSDNPNNKCQVEGGECVVRIGKGTGANVQLFQAGLTVVAGKSYTLTFRAKTEDLPRSISVVLHEHLTPYTPLGLETSLTVGPGMSTLTKEFVATGASSNARLRFAFAGAVQPNDVLHLDDIVLEETVVVQPPPVVDPPPVIVTPPPIPPTPTEYQKGYATGYAAGLAVGSGTDTTSIVQMLTAIAGVWVPNAIKTS